MEWNESWLIDNQIADEGTEMLCEVLKVNTTLMSLNLGSEEDEKGGGMKKMTVVL